jgi:hypothetical protein
MSVASGAPPTFVLPESPDHQIVTVRSVETQNVQDRLPVGGKNDLTDSQKRLSPWHIQKICRTGIRCGCVHFFVRVSDFNLVITPRMPNSDSPERSREQTRKLGCREVAGLERKGSPAACLRRSSLMTPLFGERESRALASCSSSIIFAKSTL